MSNLIEFKSLESAKDCIKLMKEMGYTKACLLWSTDDTIRIRFYTPTEFYKHG